MNNEPTGFRRDIMVLHHLSDLMEKHPALPRPNVTLAPQYKREEMVRITWHLSADWSGGPKWEYAKQTYEEHEAARKEYKRIDLEQRIAAIVDALGEGVEWEKNDPSKEEYYYTLSTVWRGASVNISTSRDDVCEKVVVLETEHEEEAPDPELTKTFMDAVPKVKVMVKDTITEWQCNEVLAEKTAPKHTRTVTEIPA